jgi:hypothetical protein
MTPSVGQDLLENLSVYEIVNLTFPLVQADRGAELYELVSLEYTVDAKEPTTPFGRQLARHSSRAKSVPRKSIFEGVRDALERWQFRQRYKITNRLQERARARQERKFSNSWYEAKLRAGLPADYLEDLRALTHLLEMQGVADAEAGRPSPAVGRHVAITTMRASIASGAASLPIGILMMFIDACMFTVDQALRQTASSADESMFVNLIRALATGLNGSLRELAITCASRLKTGSNKAIALAILARSGTTKNMEELLSQAVELASEIQDAEVRARTLLTVAAQTSPELRINVEPSLAIVRNALTQEWQSHLYYDALVDIIHLGLADEALSIVGIDQPSVRAIECSRGSQRPHARFNLDWGAQSSLELLASRGRDSLFRDLRSVIPILARVGGTPAVEQSLIGVIAARRSELVAFLTGAYGQ